MGSPVHDALDRLASIGWLSPQEAQDLATLRQRLAEQDTEIQRLQKIERNNSVLFDKWKAAEAELERLRRHPDAWSQEAFDQQKQRAEAAEADVRRLREGLREIAEMGLPDQSLVVKARALLAGSEAEPDEGGEA